MEMLQCIAMYRQSKKYFQNRILWQNGKKLPNCPNGQKVDSLFINFINMIYSSFRKTTLQFVSGCSSDNSWTEFAKEFVHLFYEIYLLVFILGMQCKFYAFCLRLLRNFITFFLNSSLLSRISSNYDWHHSIRWHQFFHIWNAQKVSSW